MKKIGKALMIVLCGLFSFLTLNVVKADEIGNVARIGEIEYATLDEAVKAVSLAQKHIEYIKKGLKESLKDKQEFSEELRARRGTRRSFTD